MNKEPRQLILDFNDAENRLCNIVSEETNKEPRQFIDEVFNDAENRLLSLMSEDMNEVYATGIATIITQTKYAVLSKLEVAE
jgi:shikimate kinase